ncbi:MAG TPA: YihY/virulence factor BrkB family protein, partial [Pseudolabrys sp.]|nr:YihY/virulence factor BrkB family protein [Pseudolabrys sp.]
MLPNPPPPPSGRPDLNEKEPRAEDAHIPTPEIGGHRSADEPLGVHQRRAREQGRGRQSRRPWHIPWRGWKDVLWRTYNETWNDRLFYVAAGVAFFVLLSIFPAISAIVSCYALIADPGTITSQLSLLHGVIPAGTYDLLQQQADHIVKNSAGSLTTTFAVSFVIALWSASSGVKAIVDALNVVYEQVDDRGIIRYTIESLLLTLAGLAVLLASAAAFVFLPLAFHSVGLRGATGTITSVLRWPFLFLLLLAVLGFLYRHGPYREAARISWVSIGSLFATAGSLAASALLSWYLSNLANYSATYGS